MPHGAVYVGRPTIWGNPFAVTRSSEFHGLAGSWFVRGEDGAVHHPTDDTQTSARHKAVELYAAQVLEQPDARVGVEMIRAELAGHDLVCWCPRGEPCHADFLLAVANTPAPVLDPASATAGTRPGVSLRAGCPTCGVPRPSSGPLVQQVEALAITATTHQVQCPTCGSH